MDIIQFKKARFIPIHIVFWIGVWFFYVYFFSYNATNTAYVFWFSSFLLPATMITAYFFIYYLIPKYLLNKRYWHFVLYSLYTLVFSTYFIILTIYGSFIFLSRLNIANVPVMSRNFAFVLILIYLIVGLVSFVNLIQHNFQALTRNKELENKILETQLELKNQELSYLKKQIHPHFLFNTLNTIYGFALKKSDYTPEIILKLSNLLDYILYQVQKPSVSLEKELLHIEEYLELEKIRFKDTLNVSFKKGQIPFNYKIPPMLFIPFVENAFKHGSIVNGFLTIKMTLNVTDEGLMFGIKNTIKETLDEKRDSNGLGLDNIRKRLDLLFKDNYELQIVCDNGWYAIKLELPNINA
ncbi:sensor histidine kinase [Aquimarina rhabdastrellae]